jgi:hypothetical protein
VESELLRRGALLAGEAMEALGRPTDALSWYAQAAGGCHRQRRRPVRKHQRIEACVPYEPTERLPLTQAVGRASLALPAGGARSRWLAGFVAAAFDGTPERACRWEPGAR